MIDQVISSDFAALAAEAKRNIPAVDALVPADQPEHASLLRLATAYADGAARAAWGATALAYVATMLVVLDVRISRAHWVFDGKHWDFPFLGRRFFDYIGSPQEPTTAFWVFVVGALIAGAVRRRSAARFGAAVGSSPRPLMTARVLVGRSASWSLALGIAGTTAFGTFFAALIAFKTSGDVAPPMWSWLVDHRTAFVEFGQWYIYGTDRLRDLSIAIAAVIALAVWVARRRPRIFHAWWVGYGALAIALLCASGAFALALDNAFPFAKFGSGVVPHFERTRTLVTMLGAAGLFVAIASRNLRRSAAEQALGARAELRVGN